MKKRILAGLLAFSLMMSLPAAAMAESILPTEGLPPAVELSVEENEEPGTAVGSEEEQTAEIIEEQDVDAPETVETDEEIPETASSEKEDEADSVVEEDASLVLGGVSLFALAAPNAIDTYAITGPDTVEVGETITLTGNGNSGHEWSSNNTSVATVSRGNTNSVTVTGVSEGTVTITHKYGSGKNKTTETFTVTVTAASPTVKVYVYVSSTDTEGNSWRNNEEFQDLIGLSVCDANGYFPAGVVELDRSFFSGRDGADTSGAGLIKSEQDWQTLLAALGNIDTSTLNGTYGVAWPTNGNFSQNRGNSVSDYLKQAEGYTDQVMGWGSGHTALFRWWSDPQPNTVEASLGFDDQSVKYHLDLCFSTQKITFITGNNGITSGDAQDGTKVDERVYITGSTIQEPRNLYIPDGYKFMGYYTDANFTTEWNGIGTPLNDNQTVYIKITPQDNVVIHYEVAQGEGDVTLDEEAFNPKTGNPSGSTASPAEGYVFEGWYSDEACTQNVSGSSNFTPETPVGGWHEGGEYYYYAKFVPAIGDLKITKKVNIPGDDFTAANGTTFTFTVEVANPGDANKVNGNAYAIYETVTVSGSATQIQVGTASFADGKATGISITMDSTGSKSIIIEDLPLIAFKVTEDETNLDLTGYYYVSNETDYGSENGQITVSSERNAEVKITNTYKKWKTVTVTKKVAGNMGDVNQQFEFTVTQNGSTVKTENITSGNSFTITNLKETDTIVITETDYSSQGYTTAYAVGDNATTTGRVCTLENLQNDTNVTFTNTKIVVPPTGVSSDAAPYLIMVGLALALGGWMLVRRRRELE